MPHKDKIFIDGIVLITKKLAEVVPDKAAQYADEEYRLLFSRLEVLFTWVKEREMKMKMTRVARVFNPEEVETTGVMDKHVGGSNYSQKKIQPWTLWEEYGLNPWDADIIKRVLRTKTEEGVQPAESRILDYEKIKHICDKRISDIKKGDPFYQNFTKPQWVSDQSDSELNKECL